MGGWSLNPPAHDFIEMGLSRRFFRVCICARHHPLARTRLSDCLAEKTPSLRFPTEDHLGFGLRPILLEALSSKCGV